MYLKEFVFSPKFSELEKKLTDTKLKILANSFNLFTLSSYNSYLENFHSDIIAFLLNPKSVHNNSIYLELFINYLSSLGFDVDSENYNNTTISREIGKIDIWITDNKSRKSIIIENKINNAVDQEKQLERYYDYAIRNGYAVDCIIYLSLNGDNTAPSTGREQIDKIVLNVAACRNDNSDLFNGWLKKCHQVSKKEEMSSLIFQYGKLINHLSNKGMNKELQKEFYEIVSKSEGQERIKTIVELASGLLEYRADMFVDKLGDIKPFRKKYRYKANHWLFENYIDSGNTFKLDVYFLNDGSARIDFWNPGKEETVQHNTTYHKLSEIGLINDFIPGGFGGGHYKIFKDKDISTVDNLLILYVQDFLFKLSES